MLRSLSLVALIVAAVAVPAGAVNAAALGDWPMVDGGPTLDGFNVAEHALQPTGMHLRYRLSGAGGPFIVASGLLVAVGSGHRAMAWDVHTGKLRHTYGPTTTLGFTYAAGRLYEGGNVLTAISPNTGRALFTARLPGAGPRSPVSFPVLGAGAVFSTTTAAAPGGGGHQYAVDATNGKLLWSTAYKAASIACVTGGRVYMTYTGGTAAAYEARSGRVVWRKSKAGYDWLASGGRLFTTYGSSRSPGEARAYSAGGRLLWHAKGVQVTAAAYGKVYGLHGRDFSDVVALDARTGKRIWIAYGINSAPSRFGLAVANGTVYAVRGTGDIVAIDANSGRIRSEILAPLGYVGANFLVPAQGMLFESAFRPVKGKQPKVEILAFGR